MLVDRRAILPERVVFNTTPASSGPRYAAAAVSVSAIVGALFAGPFCAGLWAAGAGPPGWSECATLWVLSMGTLWPITPIAIAYFRPGMAPYQQLTVTSSWLEVTGERVDFEQIEDIVVHGNSIQIRAADRTLSLNSMPDVHQAITQAVERYRALRPSRVPEALQRLRHVEHRG